MGVGCRNHLVVCYRCSARCGAAHRLPDELRCSLRPTRKKKPRASVGLDRGAKRAWALAISREPVAATADRRPGGASCSELALRGLPPGLGSRHAPCRQAFSLAGRPSRRGVPLPQFVPPQLSQPVEKPPSGPQWLHEIKLDGYRMAARIDNGRVQLLTRTGLDWTAKYPSAIVALAINVKIGYLDGELCGVDDAGLPSFAQTHRRPAARASDRRSCYPASIGSSRSLSPKSRI
jgi:ATP-dependent DNA ligase